MISTDLAQKLKDAGLIWRANINDFFAILDRGMDERVFVLADMQAQLDVFRGWPVVTFHGTAEWALDYILTSEVVWIPREEQLRENLLALLSGESDKLLSLIYNDNQYICAIQWRGQTKRFAAASAANSYGLALLFALEQGGAT